MITNIEAEHLDHYKNIDEIKDHFSYFANHVPFWGCAFLGIDSPGNLEIQDKIHRRTVTYGLNENAELRAEKIRREKITCSNLQKETTMESVLNAEKIFGDVKEISTVDGIRFQFEDGWVLIRPSGTEPIIRITVEAHKEKRAHELMNISRKFVKDILGERT